MDEELEKLNQMNRSTLSNAMLCFSSTFHFETDQKFNELHLRKFSGSEVSAVIDEEVLLDGISKKSVDLQCLALINAR